MNCKSPNCTMEATAAGGYCDGCASEIAWLEDGSAFNSGIARSLLLLVSSVIVVFSIGLFVRECRPVGEPASFSADGGVSKMGIPCPTSLAHPSADSFERSK